MGDVVRLRNPLISKLEASEAALAMCRREGVTLKQAKAVAKWLFEEASTATRIEFILAALEIDQ